MKPNELLKNILADAKVGMHDEFDKNFERKGFFNDKWKTSKFKTSSGSTMMRSGKLRKGLQSKVKGSSIVFSNSMPYAAILNEGGTITVTAKMKRFFWAMYYKASNASKNGSKQRKQRFSVEANQWKSLALQKVGAKMKIEQRQFIGDHPMVGAKIDSIVKKNVQEFNEQLFKKLNS